MVKQNAAARVRRALTRSRRLGVPASWRTDVQAFSARTFFPANRRAGESALRRTRRGPAFQRTGVGRLGGGRKGESASWRTGVGRMGGSAGTGFSANRRGAMGRLAGSARTCFPAKRRTGEAAGSARARADKRSGRSGAEDGRRRRRLDEPAWGVPARWRTRRGPANRRLGVRADGGIGEDLDWRSGAEAGRRRRRTGGRIGERAKGRPRGSQLADASGNAVCAVVGGPSSRCNRSRASRAYRHSRPG